MIDNLISLMDDAVLDDSHERDLAAHYAPIIRFDRHEPFLPLGAGITVFRQSAPSPSFPRLINLGDATMAIEYAVWWDWDIQHLYELEHIWVYIDLVGRVIRAEASWHGGYHDMATDGQIPLYGERVILYSEPGKHAFAPVLAWLLQRRDITTICCGEHAGTGGVLVTDLFRGRIPVKNETADRSVERYLKTLAFTPSFDFSQHYSDLEYYLVPWIHLDRWIPGRVAEWVRQLSDADST